MKTSAYTFALLLFIVAISPAHAQKIPLLNGDFEQWEDSILYTDFFPYSTSNPIAYILTGAPNVVPVPGCGGSATAAQLTTIDAGGEIVPGVLNWNDDPNDILGVPYTGRPDTFKACLSYDIMPNDTAAITVLLKVGSMLMGGFHEEYTGSQLTPIEVAIPLFYLNGMTPDSLVFVVSSGKFDNEGVVGSTLTIDKMRFTGTTEQLPNGDLENNTLVQTEIPTDWATTNDFQVVLDGPPSVTKSMDSHSGMYALKLETTLVDFDGTTDTVGFMTNGEFTGDDFEGGKPLPMSMSGNYRPLGLCGYYQYAPVGNDTALGLVTFSYFDTLAGQRIQSDSFWIKFAPAAMYTPFAMPIDLSTFPHDPDTAYVMFSSSDLTDGGVTQSTVGIGSVLMLDDLNFIIIPGAVDALFEEKAFNLYPNPVTTTLHLTWETATLQQASIWLYDLQGRAIKHKPLPSGSTQTQLSVSDLPRGMYIVKWLDEAGKVWGSEKVVVE